MRIGHGGEFRSIFGERHIIGQITLLGINRSQSLVTGRVQDDDREIPVIVRMVAAAGERFSIGGKLKRMRAKTNHSIVYLPWVTFFEIGPAVGQTIPQLDVSTPVGNGGDVAVRR